MVRHAQDSVTIRVFKKCTSMEKGMLVMCYVTG